MALTRLEKEQRKARLETLNDMLELIQMDFDKLTPQGRVDALVKAQAFGPHYKVDATVIADLVKKGVKKADIDQKTHRLWELLKERLPHLKDFIETLADNKDSIYIYEFKPTRALAWTRSGGVFLEDLPYEVEVEVWRPAKGMKLGTKRGEVTPSEFIKAFRLVPEFLPLVNTVAKALNGVPMDAVKRCENEKCHKVFAQTTEREKRFCCQRCQNTVAVRYNAKRLAKLKTKKEEK